jgi:hypothetical protein
MRPDATPHRRAAIATRGAATGLVVDASPRAKRMSGGLFSRARGRPARPPPERRRARRGRLRTAAQAAGQRH